MQRKTRNRLLLAVEFMVLAAMVALSGLQDRLEAPTPPTRETEALASRVTASEARRILGRQSNPGEMETIVAAAYEAGRQTKSLGPQGQAALRLLSAGFRESGFHPKVINRRLNRDGSVDFGLMQVNSVHLRPAGRSEWDLFCRQKGFSPAKHNLLNPRINMLFASRIQEMQVGHWSYQWAGRDRPDQAEFYRILVGSVSVCLKKYGIDWKTLKKIEKG